VAYFVSMFIAVIKNVLFFVYFCLFCVSILRRLCTNLCASLM